MKLMLSFQPGRAVQVSLLPLALLVLSLCPPEIHAATKTWDGGGDGRSWHNATNWSGDTLPVTGDDVVIEVPGTNATIVYAGANLSLKSLQTDETLIITSGDITLTSGPSWAHGGLLIEQRNALVVNGPSASFASTGSVYVVGATLAARGGGLLVLPTLGSYQDGGACCGALLEASGAGSILDLPGITNVTGDATWTLTIRALSGASVNLSNVVQMGNGNVSFIADGSNSVVHLEGLTAYTNSRPLNLIARNGGIIQSSNLVDGATVTVDLAATGHIPTAQLRRALGLTISGQNRSFPALTNADGATLRALSGAVVSFPALTAYHDDSSCCGALLEANGAGSTLDLGSLTNLGGDQTWTLHIRAQAGGNVLLGGVTGVDNGNIYFLADGTNSKVILTNLTAYTGPTRLVSFEARNAGTIQTPLLSDGAWATFTVRSGGTLNLTQLTRSRGFTIEGIALTLPLLTNLNGANVSALAGGSITFPALTAYADTAGCCGTVLEANGVDTFLSFPALTSLTGNPVGAWRSSFRALNGGQVRLSSLSNIPDSNLYFLADGTNSLVVLTNLASFAGPNGELEFEARNAGVVQSPLLTDGGWANFTVRSGGTLDLSQLTRFRGLTVQNAALALPAVTNLDGSSLSVSAGGNLTLPGITSYVDTSGCCGALWEANGAGAVLNLPSLTSLKGNPTWAMIVRALAGGQVLLGSVIQVPDSLINFLADGTNSYLALSNLTSYASPSRQATFEARNTGVVELTPGPFSATRATLTFQSAGEIQLGSLDLYTGAILNGDGLFDADVFNYGGTVAGGTSPGILTLNHDYIQAGGTLHAEIRGTTPGTQYDRVVVNGAATLHGTLQVSRINNFVPDVTNVFTILTAASVSGNFSNYSGLDAGSSREFVPATSATEVTLAVTFSSGASVIALSPTNSATNSLSSFVVTFSEPVLASSFATSDATLTGPSGAIPITSINAHSLTNYRLNFAPQIAPGNYTLTLGPNINDLAGNPMNQDGDATNGEAGQDVFQSILVLNDNAPPTVTAIAPPGPVSVNVSALIIVFNEPLLAASFTTADIALTGPGGAIGLSSLTQSNSTTWIAAFPVQSAVGTYTYTIGPNVQDATGNSMTAAYGGSFTIDRSGPSVASMTPSGSITQAVAFVDLMFSEPLNLATFTAVDAALTGPAGAITVNSVASLGGGGYRLAFAPQPASGTYTLVVGPQISDGAGNLMNQDGDATFGEATQDRYTNSFTIFSPDLAVLGVTGPTNGLPGENITVSWLVTNSGNAAVSRVIAEQVFLSTDATLSNDFRIASFELTNSLPPGASLSRTQTVTLPVNGPAGALRLVVQTDANNEVPEGNEANNFAIADDTLTLPLALTLQFDGDSVAEGGSLAAVISRNGPATSPLVVSLSSTDSGELTTPAAVTIPAGQTEAVFTVNAVADGIADGPQAAGILASAAAFLTGSNALTVMDADIPNLSLVISNLVLVEGELGYGSVTREGDLTAPLQVTLGSSSPGQLTLPATVTIPASQASAPFTILAVDDAYVEALRGYSVSAVAAHHGPASSTVNVFDNDQPTLVLALDQAQIREGAGPNAATLTMLRVNDAALPVDVEITSSAPGEISFAARVTFNPGELVKLIPLSPLDDAVVETNRTVTLTVQALETLSLNPIAPGVATNVTILDDDGPSLALTFTRDWACSSADTSSPLAQLTATLTRAGAADAINVSLNADPSGLLAFPDKIILGAGVTTTNFTVTTGTVSPAPPGQVVILTATAAGYASAIGTLQSVTTCAPDLVIQNLAVPTSGLTDAYFSINYRETNVGAAFSIGGQPSGITNVSQKVYLSTDPYPGGDTFLGAVVFNGTANPYTFLDRSATLRLPSVPGDYWVIVEADGSNDVSEVSEANNFAGSATPIHVDPAYTATVAAGFDSALAGTPVELSGMAHKFGTTQPAPFELVSLHIGLRGTTRIIAALTDANGNFAATFTPLPGEAGTYTVGASHPGITNGVPSQDTFTLVGMKANPATLALTIPALTIVTQEIALANLGDVALSGLTLSVLGLPPEFSVNATVTPALAPFSNGTLSLVLGVNVDTNLTRTFTVRVTSAEGAIADVILTLTAESLRPRLVALPGSLTAGVVPGTQRFLEFTVINQGGAASGELTVQPPVFPFLNVLSPPTMPALAPGASNIVTLQLAPAPDQTLGLYTGDLLVSDGVASVYVPGSFRVVSTNTGTLLVEATDQFTYYAEGAPRVVSALVELKDPYTGTVITNKLSDALGLAVFTNLTEGYYEILVTADEHDPFQTTLFVAAADTTYQEALMNRQTVQFFWNVVPTEIGDRTRITIEAVFETVVPVPVLTVSPSVIDLASFPNGGSINLTITNHGLLAAQDVALAFSEFDCWRITPLISEVGTLAARSAITIPVAICKDATCTRNFSGCPAGGGLAARPVSEAQHGQILQILQRVGNVAAHGGGGSCGGGAVTYRIPCGNGGVGGSAPVGVSNAGGGGCAWVPGGGGSGTPGGFGGGGGGSGSGNCNPCALEVAGVLAQCALDYVLPLPDIISCGQDAYECYTEPSALGCASAIVSCLEAAGKQVPIAGDVLDALSCLDDVLSACGGGGLGGALGFRARPDGWYVGQYAGRFADSLPDYPYPGMAEVALAGVHVQMVLGVYSNFFGGQQWLEAASGNNFGDWLTLLKAGMDNAGDSSNRISVAERALLTAHALTNDLSLADINQFLDRWNRTLDYAALGIYYSTNVPTGMSTDFLAFDIQRRHLELANEAVEEAAERGFANVFEEMRTAIQQLRAFVFQPSGGVCAQVRLRIDQEAVIARDAFRASLEIVNDSATSLSNVTVDLLVMDESGRIVNSLFAIPAPTLSGIANITGTGEVMPAAPGKVEWTIIPTTETATNNPAVYFVSGSIRYTQNGAATVVPLSSQAITVYPIAQLDVTYFHQRDVLADDPFTDEIEPSVPYSLAVLIRNSGLGAARNVRITSAQPQIIENEKGLFIDFQIIATEVAGQNVLPSLTANFGDVAPGEIAIGRWLLKSTLQGLFVDYSANFEHLDGLGDPRASIIRSVDIRELIRIVSAPGVFQDNLPDMLVNDFADLEDLPDKLYLSDGSVQPVSIVTTGAVTGILSSGNLQVTLAASLPAGWSYLRVPDPGQGNYRLKQVIRSDNVSLSVGTNVWTTDRTFIGGGKKPILEDNLHLLDFNGPGSYTLVYEPLPTPDTTPPASAVSNLPTNSFPQIPLTWTGSDAGGSGLATFDIYVSDNSGPFTLWLENTPLFGAVYPGVLGHQYAFYSVAVDQSGNSETAPVIADAATVVSRSNTPPVLIVGTNATVAEGATVVIVNSATDAEADVQTLTFSLASGAPPNAAINPTTGRITWPTGEGNGPGTNTLGVIVSDSGSPALSSTGFVTVIVNEVNQAPFILPVASFTINEGSLFTHTFTATDADLPTNTITWSLGAGAPPGTAIGTNSGLFTWTPTTLQGPSTNTFDIIATDNGQPPLAGNRSLTIVVRDSQGDFILTVGRTNVFAGESNAVSLLLAAGVDVASVSFTLTTDDARLADLSLQNISPLAADASLVQAGSNRVAISLGALPGQSLPVGVPLASFAFRAPSNAGSAFVSLQPLDLVGEHSSAMLLTNGLGQAGRVVVIGEAPLLEALNHPPRELVLWGIPGQDYRVDFITALGDTWQLWQNIVPVAPMTPFPAHTNLSPVFYRAIRNPTGP